MKRRTALALGAMTVLCLGVAAPSTAVAQTAKDLVGAWMLISSDTVRPDGIKIPTFGDDPKGIIIFTSDGRFIYLLSRSDLPKFASNNRMVVRSTEAEVLRYMLFGWWIERFVQGPKHFEGLSSAERFRCHPPDLPFIITFNGFSRSPLDTASPVPAQSQRR
jgi:lipocalin-like protein